MCNEKPLENKNIGALLHKTQQIIGPDITKEFLPQVIVVRFDRP